MKLNKVVYLTVIAASFAMGTLFALLPLKIALPLALMALGLVFLLLKPHKINYAVAFYSLLYFAVKELFGGYFLSGIWDELLLAFCFFLWVFKWVFYRNEKAYKWTPIDFSLLLFIFVSTFMFFYNSPDFAIGLEGLRAVVEYMLFFFVVVQFLNSPTAAKRLVYALVFVGTFMGLHGIYQYVAWVDIPSRWLDRVETSIRTRAFSVAGNPNVLGCVLVIMIPLAVALVFSEKKTGKKLLFSFSTAAMTLCLLFTGSRSAFLGLALAVLVYALLNRDKRLLAGVVVVSVLTFIFVPIVRDRFAYLLSADYINSSLRDGRLSRWPKAVEMVKQNPWFGVGLGRFGGAVAAANNIPGTFYIDNYYLKIAVEMGIPGLLFFLLLFYNTLAWSLRSVKRLRESPYYGNIALGALSGMVGVLFTNIVLNNFDAPMIVTYFWTAAAIAAYLGFVERDKVLCSH